MHDNPGGEALRRLIRQVERLPVPPNGEAQRHLFETQERFFLLRRLAIEGNYLRHQGRQADSSLLLEVGALVTHRLIGLSRALPAGRLTRKEFLARLRSQVAAYLGTAADGGGGGGGLKPLAAAQGRLDELERSLPRAASPAVSGALQRCAVDCSAFVALFLGAWWRD